MIKQYTFVKPNKRITIPKELTPKIYEQIQELLAEFKWKEIEKAYFKIFRKFLDSNMQVSPAPASSNFVDLYLKHTQKYESPTSFWKWSAYTTIGAVLRDNCYRKLGDNKIYPNIYTLLLADSAVHRKGQPIKLCEELVKSAKSTKVISGRSSIQGILDELHRGETDKKTGKITSGGSALFSASELSAGIVNDPEAIKILTDIYDFKDEYTSRLRGHGVFQIKNICFSMMAASNEELLRDVYDGKAVFGGLLGRTFLIKPSEFRPANSLFEIRAQELTWEPLIEILKEMAKLTGEFTIDNEAKEAYENWYGPFRKSYEFKPDKSGISGRIHTSVLKLAMILAVNYTGKLVIEKQHMLESIKECVDLLPNYSGFVMAGGKSTIAEVAALLIEDIWTAPKKCIAKGEFLSRHFHLFDADLVDKCINTLSQADLVKMTIVNGTMESYTITEKCIQKFDLKK